MARSFNVGEQRVTVGDDWSDEDIASVYGPDALGPSAGSSAMTSGGGAPAPQPVEQGPSQWDEVRKGIGSFAGSIALPLLTRNVGGALANAGRQVLASGLGAMGGEAAQEAANAAGITGDPTRSANDLVKSMAVRGAEGVAYEALGQGVINLPKAFKAFNPRLSAEAKLANDDLKKYGGHLPLDTQSENWLYQQIGGLARGSFTGSGSFKALEKLNSQALEAFENDVAGFIGKSMTGMDDYTRGLVIRDILVDGEVGFKSAAHGLYGALDDASKGVKVDFTPVRELAVNTLSDVSARGGLLKSGPVADVINKLTNLPANVPESQIRETIFQLKAMKENLDEVTDGTPNVLRHNINSLIAVAENSIKGAKKVEVLGGPPVKQINAAVLRDKAADIKARNYAKDIEEENLPIKELIDDLIGLKAEMSFAEASALRSDMLSIKRGLEDAMGKEKANYFVSKFTTAINEQMETAAKGVSPDFFKSYEKTNRFYSRGKETFNNKLIRRLVDDEVPVEQIGKIIARSGNVTAFKDFQKALRKSAAVTGDKAVYNKGVSAVRAGMIDEIFTNSTRDGVINGKMLVNKINNYNMQRTLKEVMTPDQFRVLNKFAIAAERVQTKPEAGLSMIMQLTQAGGLVAAAKGGLEVGEGAILFGGPYALAKAFTNDGFVQALDKAVKFQTSSASKESIKAAVKAGAFLVETDRLAAEKRSELNRQRRLQMIEQRDQVSRQNQSAQPSSYRGS